MRVALTDISIRQLPNPANGNNMYWDTIVPGFGVRVTAKSKAFFIIYGKRRRSKTLGKYPAMTLKKARAEAIQLQATITQDAPKNRLDSLTEARDPEGQAIFHTTPDRPLPARVRQALAFLPVPNRLKGGNQTFKIGQLNTRKAEKQIRARLQNFQSIHITPLRIPFP